MVSAVPVPRDHPTVAGLVFGTGGTGEGAAEKRDDELGMAGGGEGSEEAVSSKVHWGGLG